jgi:dipeptidase E
MGLIPFNINAHYIDLIPGLKHQGESRETRIKEFHQFHDIPVIGLREGSYLEVLGDQIFLRGDFKAKLFRKDMVAEEITEIPAF